MALVRILVDGYSLLHRWPELAPGKPRHAAGAREALVATLTQYRDAIGIPLTLVFDGATTPPHRKRTALPEEIEVIYSRRGQTADEVIERATHRLLDYGEVLVVTDDHAERDTVLSLGGLSSSCAHFIQDVETALDTLGRDIHHHNRRERSRFRQPRMT